LSEAEAEAQRGRRPVPYAASASLRFGLRLAMMP